MFILSRSILLTEIREWADVIWSFPALLLQEEKGEVRVVAKSTSGNVCVRERAECLPSMHAWSFFGGMRG